MSRAPQNLIDLRRYLADQYVVKRALFGIRGFCGAKRNQGYHLAKSDIYSDCGKGDRDYSVRRKRDKAGLSENAAGFDISAGAGLPVSELQKLLPWIVAEAKAGRMDIQEVIGPNEKGDATDYRKPDFLPLVRKDPERKDGHRRHIHVSFPRDLTHPDKLAPIVPMFAGYFGDTPDPGPDDPVLRLGDTGPAVAEMQGLLNAHGATLNIDGQFGPITDTAVRKFQLDNGLVTDGIVGPTTWEALYDVPIEEPPPDPLDPDLAKAYGRIAQLEEAIGEMVQTGVEAKKGEPS